MPFPKPNRAMLFDSAGLACYIAWSFVFWNGSVLFGDLRHEAPVGEAQIVQAALTALAALVLVLLARRTAPLRRRTVLLAVFAAVSSLAIVVAALAGFGRAPMGWMLIAFALSGLGSTLRLGWEERMSVQGVERTAVCAGTAYLLGFLLFALISLLPALSVLAVSVLLPFGAFGLLGNRGAGRTGTGRIRGADAARFSGRRQSARIVVARSLEADGGYFARVLRLRGDAGERRDRRFRGVFRVPRRAGRRACACVVRRYPVGVPFLSQERHVGFLPGVSFDGYGFAAPGIA